ncbi:MAG: hypothetical protein WBD40_06425 [Tepidisphaeraceae bacterium]
MTKTIRAHFDGRVIVPDEAVDMPAHVPMEVQVTVVESPCASTVEERRMIIERLIARAVPGINLPAAALSRESIYGDD